MYRSAARWSRNCSGSAQSIRCMVRSSCWPCTGRDSCARCAGVHRPPRLAAYSGVMPAQTPPSAGWMADQRGRLPLCGNQTPVGGGQTSTMGKSTTLMTETADVPGTASHTLHASPSPAATSKAAAVDSPLTFTFPGSAPSQRAEPARRERVRQQRQLQRGDPRGRHGHSLRLTTAVSPARQRTCGACHRGPRGRPSAATTAVLSERFLLPASMAQCWNVLYN